MRITVLGRDLLLTSQATVRDILDFLADDARHDRPPADLWCGSMRMDPDRQAGTPPLVHGAILSAAPGPETSTPTGAHLAVVAGPDAGHILAVTARGATVGRGPDCTATLDDPAMSRQHLRVWEADGVRVSENHSTNGTTVTHYQRARRLTRTATLAPGAVVSAGHTLLHVRPAPSTPVPPSIDGLPEVCGAMTSHGVLGPGTVAVCGDITWAEGFARAITLDRGREPPAGHWAEPWMRWLDSPTPHTYVVLVREGDDPPPGCTTVARATPAGVTLVTNGTRRSLPPIRVTPAAAEAAARRRAGAASVRALPHHVTWADLHHDTPRPEVGQRNAPCPAPPRLRPVMFGARAHGSYPLDLDRDGPHLLIAGATGSGTSTLLETLLGALAYEHSARDLAIAVFDFSGSKQRRAYSDLPHLAGHVSDINGNRPLDALATLDHECAARRAALAHEHHASFDAWERAGGAPPRLVVVARDFHEITAHSREFVPRLSALGAVGHELGIHLILSTRRPAGAVTPHIRALVGTTIALRVNSESESRDLIGTSEAAAEAHHVPGRAIVMRRNVRETIQVATPLATVTPPVQAADAAPLPTGVSLADHARARWPASLRAVPLW